MIGLNNKGCDQDESPVVMKSCMPCEHVSVWANSFAMRQRVNCRGRSYAVPTFYSKGVVGTLRFAHPTG